MIWLLGGYMWLFVHRPFEVWPALGSLQLERAYMFVLLLAWLLAPGKGFLPNRVHAALAFFTLVLLTGSRAAMIGLIAFGGMVLWVTFQRKGALIVFGSLAAVFVFAVLMVALPAELQDRYLTIVDSSKGPANAQESASGRMDGFMH